MSTGPLPIKKPSYFRSSTVKTLQEEESDSEDSSFAPSNQYGLDPEKLQAILDEYVLPD